MASPNSRAVFFATLMAVMLVTGLLVPQSSLAVPADHDAEHRLEQPDGLAFVGVLQGDEWFHWYETEDGHTIMRDADGYWRYAEPDPDGTLVPTGDVVGRGSPQTEPHLRHDPAVIADRLQILSQSNRDNPEPPQLTGTAHAVIILVEFSDTPSGEGSQGVHTPNYYENETNGLVFGSSAGRMRHYIQEISYTQLDIQGEVANGQWHTSAQTEVYYGGDCDPGQCAGTMNDNCNVCIYELVREAVQLADASGFDFAPYDADADGIVDHVIIVHAGEDQASAGGADDDIWSHRWSIPGGEPVDGVTVENYTMLSEHDLMSVFAHEFLHDLGSPDLYDYDYDSDPVGRWCVMGANFGEDLPSHLCGFLKTDIDGDFSNGLTGWVSHTLLSGDGNYTVLQLNSNQSGSVFLTDPAFSSGEYFVVENRQQTGYYDSSCPESGGIITHLDLDQPDGTGRFNDGPPNNSAHGAWIERPENLPSVDGAAYSQEDGEDRFDPVSIPNSNDTANIGTNIAIRNFSAEGPSMTFDYRAGVTYVSGTVSSTETWTKDASPYVVNGNVTVADGVTLTIEPGALIKIDRYYSITINGTLVADGTASDPIVFTSYYDDDFGGDTNQNGPSSGSRGDWYYLSFDGADPGCSISYCTVRFAGRAHSSYYSEAIILSGTGTELTLTNSVIEETSGSTSYYYYAIRGNSGTVLEIADSEIRYNGGRGIYTDGQLTLLNSSVHDNGGHGVERAGTGSMISDCTFVNNNGYGLYVYGGSSTVTRCQFTGNSNWGCYTNGADTEVTHNAAISNGSGIYVAGANCAVYEDTCRTNTVDGLRCNGLAAEFHDNISTDNGGFGAIVNAELVKDVWGANTVHDNGHLQAIGVYGGTVATPTQWIDDQDYVVLGSFNIDDGVTLTIEPGVTVKLDRYYNISINGTLVADGTSADPIVFTSYYDDDFGGDTNQDGASNGSRGDWYYLSFDGADSGCSMSYCTVRYAGRGHSSYYGEAIMLNGTGTELTLTNSVIEQTNGAATYYYYAIRGYTGTVLEISDSEIRYNGGRGIYTDGQLTLLNSSVHDNGGHGVERAGTGSMISDCTFVNNNGYGLYVYGGSSTVTRCQFTGNSNWGCYTNGADTEVTHNAAISNGSGIYVAGANCAVYEDTCRTNTVDGLRCNGLAAEFHDNISTDNGGFGAIVNAELVKDVWGANTVHDNGHLQAIGVYGGTVATPTQWIDDQDYAVFSSFSIGDGVVLTIEPGVTVKLDRYYMITVNGTLVADGTSADPIVFTSYYDDDVGGDTNQDGASSGSRGDWYYLSFDGADSGCSMSYCTVKYAGRYHGSYSRYSEAIILNGTGTELTITNGVIEQTYGASTYYYYAIRGYSGTALEMSDSEIRYNGGKGIYTDGQLTLLNSHIHDNGGHGVEKVGANSSFTNTHFENNGGYGLAYSEGTGSIDACYFTGNSSYGLYLHPNLIEEALATCTLENQPYGNSIAAYAGTLGGDATWSNTHTVMLNGQLTIPDGVTLLCEEGAVIKTNGSHKIQVDGALVAQGTNVDKVVFSSWRDDNYGGDTNNDGNNSQPSPGDWRGIWFNGSNESSRLGWTVEAYGGYGNESGVHVQDCNLDFSECIIINNLDRGVKVSGTGNLTINNSDIYGNGFGLENLNTSVTVEATDCYWGHSTGPYHAGLNPGGQGNAASDYVDFIPFLPSSMDNPWIAFTSPSTSGNYNDVLIFDLNEDDLLDLVAATEQSGLEVYLHQTFENWQETTSPITSGQYLTLDKADFNGDEHEDLLVAGSDGIRCFAGDGAGGFVETIAPLTGTTCTDVMFCNIDGDMYLDILGCSGDNTGVWVFLGNGMGDWTLADQPAGSNSYNRVDAAFLNTDPYPDIVATNAEYHGIHVWYGNGDGTWSATQTISDGDAFFALDVGDVNRDGFHDLVVGANQTGIGIRTYLGDGAGGWTSTAGPTSVGLFNDLILADLNGDTRLDMTAASQGGGIKVWVATSSGFWNYWYHPISDHIFNGLCVDDYTLNGSLDLAGASLIHGISLWDNVTPGVFQEYFAMSPSQLDFGEVMIGETAQLDFELSNVSSDTLRNVIVYTTNPEFDVSFADRDAGPFDLLPGEQRDIRVQFSPTDNSSESEAVIIHSTLAVTHIRVTGQGVDYIAPVWSIDIGVANAIGGEDNSAGLAFGAAVGATDSLDVSSGEVCLPPIPPTDVFDARFQIEGCEGSLINIHDYANEEDAFVFQWQAGAGGFPVTVSWDPASLPQGTFLISDLMGGAFVDTLNMADTNEIVIPVEQSFLEELVITTKKHSTHTYDLSQGWHLVSRAVSTEQDSLEYLFPGAISAWTWADQYIQVHELSSGIGYWVDLDASLNVSHVGEQIRTVYRTLDPGWSLLGTVYAPIDVEDIVVVPPDAITSIFGFNGSYYMPTELTPGEGYWFDASEACQVTISLDSRMGGKEGSEHKTYPIVRSMTDQERVPDWLLALDVASQGGGVTQRMEIGAASEATSAIDLSLGERQLPPVPPSTVFSSRLVIASGEGVLRDLRSAAEASHAFEVVWQVGDGGWPVVITWDAETIPENIELTMQDNLDGSFFSGVSMRACDRMVISEEQAPAGGVRIMATRTGGDPQSVRRFALHQSTPNPFKPATTIAFELPREVEVRLAVYDVKGRLVRVLTHDVWPAGEHRLIWDGRDGSGADVASGVYFSHIEAQEFVRSRKMMLLK